jgi:hypothetical protein
MNAAEQQTFKLVDESCKLLPYASINSDGEINLKLSEKKEIQED